MEADTKNESQDRLTISFSISKKDVRRAWLILSIPAIAGTIFFIVKHVL